MEQRQIFKLKLKVFKDALAGFEETLGINKNKFDPVVKDAIENGQIQKFEYCAELAWKLVKKYIFVYHGIDCSSPKSAIKEFLLTSEISETDYELLMNMIDDRNMLSHIYRKLYFDEILGKLDGYLHIMKKINVKFEKAD